MAINQRDYPNKIRPGLKANKDYSKFYYRFSINNKSHKGIIACTQNSWTNKDKIKYAEQEFLAIKDEIGSCIDINATVDNMVKLYFDTLPDTSYKKNSQSYYNRKVKKHIGSKKIKDVLYSHIQKIVNENIKNGDSPRTAKQAIEVLSPAFKIARKNRIIVYNPCVDVKIKMPKSKKIVTNATEKLTSIYNAIMKLYSDNPYYRSFFLLALQGRRKGEIINLRWEHISFEYNYYVLPDTKNDEEQKVFLPPNVKAALNEFKQEKGWVFESPINKGQRLNDAKRQTAKLKKELGDWFGLHYCRNIMVSAMAERGVDSIMMSGALGHNDPNTITKYLTMNYLQGSRIASDMIQG